MKLTIIQVLVSEMVGWSCNRRKGIKLDRNRDKVLRCGPQVSTCF